MNHAQTAGDALHILLGWAVVAVEIAVGLFAFFIVLRTLALGVRFLDSGGRSRPRVARARIEAEMARRAERARRAPMRDDPADQTRALRRRLAAIDEILRSSSFEGERAAALAARARIVAQLGAPNPN